jgi:UDP-N-acetyl-D-glucosamine dehydrogenase
MAYKANVDDDRESPSYILFDKLREKGAEVSYFDPYIPVIRPSREHGHLAGIRSVEWTKETIGAFDLVLISTAHANIDFAELGAWAKLIVDTRNALAGKGGNVVKA